jgi:hypothetical protein
VNNKNPKNPTPSPKGKKIWKELTSSSPSKRKRSKASGVHAASPHWLGRMLILKFVSHHICPHTNATGNNWDVKQSNFFFLCIFFNPLPALKRPVSWTT